ncbi:hypothetical protein [Rhizobium binae]|uniref:hypothetical protein n=1 Tax=Rhizobium binae TaxID=1138190 RepID=UPI001C83B9EE|nr:hypothetical protein [Rhizobium binae]MBX4937894.1 hypothetical protein [Rhizobium binae]MBX4944484.1 hypothetical protein [Rhizobium binae]MBX4963117.1 hypothetical protein [Rhizobium binae]MBX4979871.1 hypothetical protein [Rhizobium binae]
MLTSDFLTALGRWLRGWKQDPALRDEIAEILIARSRELPLRFRQHDGTPLYRKRHLYNVPGKEELLPLFLDGILHEGPATSWTRNRNIAEMFDRIFDDINPQSVAGAVFRHVPVEQEVVLNIHSLWQDRDFLAAVTDHVGNGRPEAAALQNFGKNQQEEVILNAPLRRDEILLLSRVSTFDSLAADTGAVTPASQDALQDLLIAANVHPEDPRFLNEGATQRVIENLLMKVDERIQKAKADGSYINK